MFGADATKGFQTRDLEALRHSRSGRAANPPAFNVKPVAKPIAKPKPAPKATLVRKVKPATKVKTAPTGTKGTTVKKATPPTPKPPTASSSSSGFTGYAEPTFPRPGAALP